MLSFDLEIDNNAKIKVFGVGGGGNNAVNRMIDEKIKELNSYQLILIDKR